MTPQDYASLYDQVARQTPELAALDGEIAAWTPPVEGDVHPKQAQADALRSAIAQCQAAMQASGLTVDVPALRLAEAKAAAVLKIDADADAIYGAVQGNRIEEYRTSEVEGSAFKAANYAGTVPPSVSSWATVKGWTAQQACDDILATAAAWRGAQAAIRAARLTRKEQAKNASDLAGVTNALAAWGAFRAAVRTQLGLAG